jgi:hypothetical protein
VWRERIFHISRRTTGWSTSSPHCSASRTRTSSTIRRGSGFICSTDVPGQQIAEIDALATAPQAAPEGREQFGDAEVTQFDQSGGPPTLVPLVLVVGQLSGVQQARRLDRHRATGRYGAFERLVQVCLDCLALVTFVQPVMVATDGLDRVLRLRHLAAWGDRRWQA